MNVSKPAGVFPQKFRPKIERLQKFYQKYSQPLFFFGGFLWDSLTLNRIDRLSDNAILFLYLLLAGVSIIVLNLSAGGVLRHPRLLKYRDWFPLSAQFFLGGLYSSYVVFYFQSASFSRTAIFLLILGILLVANEFLEKKLSNVYLQSALYFFASFSFFIFFVPVILKAMNIWTFLLSGLLSVALVLGMIFLLHRKYLLLSQLQFYRSIGVVVFLYLLFNFFYLQNWIPPVPLSLKDGGIYHHVQRIQDRYLLKMAKPTWYQFWKSDDDPFLYTPGDTVFCFTSVFAPTRLRKKIYHRWQWKNPKTGNWATTDRLGFEVSGGRESGYRGFTYKRNVSPGDWRVEVVTEEDLLLGIISFEIKAERVPLERWKVLVR